MPKTRLGRTLMLAALLACTATLRAPAACADDADKAEQGHDLYDEYCATCHGRDMVNPGGVSFDLRRFPKDGPKDGFERFRNSVLNGKGQTMPAWRDKLADEDVAVLWSYVQTGGK